MRYIKYLLAFTFFMFINFSSVDAVSSACSSTTRKELARVANYVKVSYEIKDYSEEKEITVNGSTTTYKVPKYAFEYTIYNLTDDIYVQIESTSASTRSSNIYYRDTTDGNYVFTDNNFGEIYNYTFTVKSNNSECPGSTLRTIKQTKPRYNAYSEYTYCSNSSNYYCQRFIGTEISIKGTNDFLSKIKVNNEKNNPDRDDIEDRKTFGQLLKDNWKTYSLVFVAVIIVIIIGMIVIKRRSERKGWRL